MSSSQTSGPVNWEYFQSSKYQFCGELSARQTTGIIRAKIKKAMNGMGLDKSERHYLTMTN
jgi:hypothetical protein